MFLKLDLTYSKLVFIFLNLDFIFLNLVFIFLNSRLKRCSVSCASNGSRQGKHWHQFLEAATEHRLHKHYIGLTIKHIPTEIWGSEEHGWSIVEMRGVLLHQAQLAQNGARDYLHLLSDRFSRIRTSYQFQSPYMYWLTIGSKVFWVKGVFFIFVRVLLGFTLCTGSDRAPQTLILRPCWGVPLSWFCGRSQTSQTTAHCTEAPGPSFPHGWGRLRPWAAAARSLCPA